MVGTCPREFLTFADAMNDLAGVELDEKRYTTNSGGGQFFDQQWQSEPESRLTAHEALEYLEKHENSDGSHAVAFIFQQGDRFHAIDEDNQQVRKTHGEEFKPTLRIRSRSGGTHLYYAQPDDPNDEVLLDSIGIPEKWDGEGTIADFRNTNVAKLMYAPGSYRPADKVPDDEAPVYTVENVPDSLPALGMRELPRSWLRAHARKQYRKQKRAEKNRTTWDEIDTDFTETVDGEGSQFFDLDTGQVYSAIGGDLSGEKHEHPLHGSETGTNAEYANGVMYCWREGHNCTHNAYSLCAQASRGYDANSDCGHLGAEFGGGQMGVARNPKAVFWGWEFAKASKLIEKQDAVPYRCLMWATVEAGLRPADEMFAPSEYDPQTDGKHLTKYEYNQALEWLRNKAEVPLGRDKVEGAEGSVDEITGGEEYEEGDASAEKHLTMQGIARQGKSYEICRNIEQELSADKFERGVYVAPSHQEAQATRDKLVNMGVDTAYLGGRRWARSGWGENDTPLNYSSDEFPEQTAKDPWEALEKIPPEKNQYQAIVRGAQEARFVVTVPEKLDTVTKADDHFDLIVTSEEASLSRLISTSVTIFESERTGYQTGTSMGALDALTGTAEHIVNRINDLERTDRIHDDIEAVAEFILGLPPLIKESGVERWDKDDNAYHELVAEIRARLSKLQPQADFYETRKRVKNNYPGHARELMNILYHDPDESLQGVLTRANGNEKSIEIVGDTGRVFQDLPEDATYWFAGNDITLMTEVHEKIHGDPPDPVRYMSDFAPVMNGVTVVKLATDRSANQQVADVSETIGKLNSGTGIAFGGSKVRADRAKQDIPGLWFRPAENVRDLSAIRKRAGCGMNLALSQNSIFAEGVDMETFDYTAVHTGRFKTPRKSYIADKSGNATPKFGELIRANQNSALRASDVPADDNPHKAQGTGQTAALIPDKQVPNNLFAMFERFDVNVIKAESVEEAAETLQAIIDQTEIGGSVSANVTVEREEPPQTDSQTTGRPELDGSLGVQANAGD